MTQPPANLPVVCLADNSQHADLKALHKHLQFKLKMRQEIYYTQFAPRRDRQSGEIIPYKAPAERYLRQEFAGKLSLRKWLKEKPEEGRHWAIEFLRQRKQEKQLVHPPTQVELRTLLCPSIPYYDHVGGYAAICRELGYTIRFDGGVPPPAPLEGPIVIDTREQNPLKIKHPTMVGTLKCGDYGLPPERDAGIYIERKSLADFVSTLSDRKTRGGTDSSVERFGRELERAEEVGAYIVMLVESDINQAQGFNHLPHIHSKMSPDHVFKNLRDILHRFHAFQALFVAGRVEAAAAVVRLLQMGDAVKHIDLQAAMEKGELTFE